MKYITIYLKSKPSSNWEILIEKIIDINSKNEEIQLSLSIKTWDSIWEVSNADNLPQQCEGCNEFINVKGSLVIHTCI